MVTNDERLQLYAGALQGHLFAPHSEAYGTESCTCGWYRDGWDAITYEQHIAPVIMAVADAELAALRAELEYPDLAYAVQKGGPNLDGPTVLTDEPTGDAMRWTKEDDQ